MMGDRVTASPSRIPVPMVSSNPQYNGTTQNAETVDINGVENGQKRLAQGEAKGFETFVMTGEMIIRTSQKSRNPSSRNPSDSTDESFDSQSSLTIITKTNHVSAESGFEDHDAHEKASAVDAVEDVGSPMSSSQSSALSSDVKSDVSEQTVIRQNIGSESPSVTDSSSGVVSPENSNGDLTMDDAMKDSVGSGKLVTSKSADKIVSTSHQTVRGSKSQELRTNCEFSAVSIDIEEDVAHSLDQIPQQGPSLRETNVSRSVESSPEHTKADRNHDREFIPGFISLDGSVNGTNACDTNSDHEICAKPLDDSVQSADRSHRSERDSLDPSMDPNLLEYQPPVKSVDHPSAHRLAKRLFHMDGFKKSDVARHLSKKNDFSALVAEEYLKYFNFEKDTLDMALRKFLSHFSLIGETQERERVLDHFSRRYLECNPGEFNSVDACHTLTCAIMLLNTDLHGQGIKKRMTCHEFIENLSELNDGENFNKEVLKNIYHAIKTEQIEWAIDEEDEDNISEVDDKLSAPSQPTIALHNPYLDIPDPSQTTEYKSGYIMRKCCKEPDSRKTPLGKRGWKVFYSSLRDMVLYLHKDQHSKGQGSEGLQNAIRIHHSLASKATDYTKKQHVFRLETADWAEYLIQTSDSKELQSWIDTINFVAASLSAPALPSAVGSQKKFQRSLLPATYTKLNLREQLESHDNKGMEIERDLHDHRQYPPEKGSKARIIQDYIEKENYLEHELKRYKTYVYLLKAHMAAFPELEPSLVETVIGEVDESGDLDKRASPSHRGAVQRSLSERKDVEETPPGGLVNGEGRRPRRQVLIESSI
ncbi:PH and SEC7 domain-containing protein 1-like isoform X1 [Saccostrea cucullata]|uniref:PH and SEC7 domain-containing protein 1-like isoform X1 n=1 Tax=Saccostrea cuccullata TaxID=36930 RepID=UPI002ED581A3